LPAVERHLAGLADSLRSFRLQDRAVIIADRIIIVDDSGIIRDRVGAQRKTVSNFSPVRVRIRGLKN
jgi:hypothetical protein